MAYVALSRARSLEGVHLLGLDPSSVACELKAVDEYNRLRSAYTQLPQMKAVRKRTPTMMRKRPISRALGDAGLTLPEQPPRSKKDKKTAAATGAKKSKAASAASSVAAGGFVRLRNGANWCFTNAAVQGLLACEAVRQWALGATAASSDIRRCLATLARAEESASPPLHSTEPIRRVVDQLYPEKSFLDGSQHDSSEFLECVLDAEPELRRLFLVQEREEKLCLVCGHRSEQDGDEAVTLPLKCESDGAVFWGELLKAMIESERESRCGRCVEERGELELPEESRSDSRHRVTRRLTFPEGHRLLLVRLPRLNALGQVRLATRISGFRSGDVRISGGRFRVRAAVIHDGATAARGHYSCLSTHGSQWLLKSDESVTAQKQFLRQLSAENGASASYLLLERL